MTHKCFIVLLSFTIKALAVSFNDVPEWVDEKILLFANSERWDNFSCKNPDVNKIELVLYTQGSTNGLVNLNSRNIQKIHVSKKILFIIHGWNSNAKNYNIQAIKNVLLNNFDYNVFLVNWELYAAQPFALAVCFMPKVAEIVAKFLCTLKQKIYNDFENITIIGHSLGGQMAGIIGQFVIQICNQQIGRIIALDPTGPLFFAKNLSHRLDSSDAKFVQVIHTNGGGFGYLTDCGHVDFYLGCDSIQDDCHKILFSTDKHRSSLKVAICKHLISIKHFVQSFKIVYKGITCCNCALHCPPLTIAQTWIKMGYDTPFTARGSYYVSIPRNSN